MKTAWWTAVLCGAALAACAEPLRVAILDFEDQTGSRGAAGPEGAADPAALAANGPFVLGKALAEVGGCTLIDRRDFLAGLERVPGGDRVSFLRAAQAVRADVVLRGRLQSLSAGRQSVDQGGYRTEFTRLTLRVGLEALDTRDGTVIALSDGAAETRLRQTDAVRTALSEDEWLGLLSEAVGRALPPLRAALAERAAGAGARETVRLSVKTSDDPALVEIDGILVGSTPVEALEVYRGDHVLTVTKPGHRALTRRVVLERDSLVEVPMLRTDLSAEEQKEILRGASVGVVIGEPVLTVLPLPPRPGGEAP